MHRCKPPTYRNEAGSTLWRELRRDHEVVLRVHYGFGEIDLAYSLSRESGKPVEEIFAMRASGAGWGAIKKALASSTDDPSKDKNKDKEKDKKND